jgi:hypothetical protein
MYFRRQFFDIWLIFILIDSINGKFVLLKSIIRKVFIVRDDVEGMKLIVIEMAWIKY